ncbi:hypothetical protein IM697_24695 [Streptomyces ferrugineus]|uniref:Uncharacterized protein n=1 Tax=Streptomyces ferrugineus TaxID=1413221 RepID=A0A7M2SE13_9ACTN|nr:hypothetical protein [Streptomyces ferrugineus]QOV33411.1 hypothetical protein IM697_24695 [Streptomyces ferrugineus]
MRRGDRREQQPDAGHDRERYGDCDRPRALRIAVEGGFTAPGRPTPLRFARARAPTPVFGAPDGVGRIGGLLVDRVDTSCQDRIVVGQNSLDESEHVCVVR